MPNKSGKLLDWMPNHDFGSLATLRMGCCGICCRISAAHKHDRALVIGNFADPLNLRLTYSGARKPGHLREDSTSGTSKKFPLRSRVGIAPLVRKKDACQPSPKLAKERYGQIRDSHFEAPKVVGFWPPGKDGPARFGDYIQMDSGSRTEHYVQPTADRRPSVGQKRECSHGMRRRGRKPLNLPAKLSATVFPLLFQSERRKGHHAKLNRSPRYPIPHAFCNKHPKRLLLLRSVPFSPFSKPLDQPLSEKAASPFQSQIGV